MNCAPGLLVAGTLPGWYLDWREDCWPTTLIASVLLGQRLISKGHALSVSWASKSSTQRAIRRHVSQVGVDVRSLCCIECPVPGGNLLGTVFVGMANMEVIVRGDGVTEGMEREARLQGLRICLAQHGQTQAGGLKPAGSLLPAYRDRFRWAGRQTIAGSWRMVWISFVDAFAISNEKLLSRLSGGRRWISD
jgi:hypothetical protein